MSGFWLWAPRIELARFAPIDFFPLRPTSLEGIPSFCLGTKSRTIGDALMLTTLPGKLRRLHPSVEIYAYPRGFNPVVFYGNPHVRGVRYLPRKVYGDDCNWGEGQLIQLKERFFELPISDPPKPEIHLLEREKRWAQRLVGNEPRGKPIVAIHPWGGTVKSVATRHFWETVAKRWSHSYRFWQVGIHGHVPVPGCDRYLMSPHAYRHARKTFAAMSRAALFIGLNSGPMHIARAFDIPSLILTREGEIPTIFKLRKTTPYFLYQNWKHSFLYEENTHLDLTQLSEDQLLARVDKFLEASHPSARRGVNVENFHGSPSL